jgi:hypothetical protein
MTVSNNSGVSEKMVRRVTVPEGYKTVREVSLASGYSQNWLYTQAKSGKLNSIKLESRTFLKDDELLWELLSRSASRSRPSVGKTRVPVDIRALKNVMQQIAEVENDTGISEDEQTTTLSVLRRLLVHREHAWVKSETSLS